MTKRHLLFYLSCCLIVSALSAAEDILLYASPSTDWGPIIVADARSAQVRKGLPLENQPNGTSNPWFQTTYTSRYTGYALATDIASQKNPLPVYLTKDEDSPVIAWLTPKERSKKVSQGKWTEVTFKEPISVYFQRGSSNRASRAHNDNLNKQDSAPPLHVFEGKLKLKHGFLGFEPRYRYELVDTNNKLIGYIKTNNLFVSAPLSNYVGRDVLVQGTVSPTNNDQTLVIHATTLQLKNAGI